MNTINATQQLGTWAAQVGNNWSPALLGIAAHALEDTVASAVAGAGDTGSEMVRKTLSSHGAVPVIGGTFCTSAAEAALANGYASHAVEMDENFLIGLGHLCTVVVPAILSIGHEIDADGRRALDALIVSSEVMARIGCALSRAHTDRGWHGTSTVGALAAAAACARLLGLQPEEMTHALAIAVSMSAGPKVQFGTATKPLHAGLAAQAGVIAAKLAAQGLRASPNALEGQNGFGELYGGVNPVDWSDVVPQAHKPLAIEWAGMAFKPWPVCGATHKAIAGVMSLRQTHKFSAQDVSSVVIEVSHGVMVNLKYPNPQDHKQAQFSMPYAIALALQSDRLTLADYTAEAIHDAATRKLMPLVSMVRNPLSTEGNESATDHFPHKVKVSLRDGRCFEQQVQHMKGGLNDPLTAEDRRAKFDTCCEGILPRDQLETLRGMLADPLNVSIRALMRQLAFSAGADDGQRFHRAKH